MPTDVPDVPSNVEVRLLASHELSDAVRTTTTLIAAKASQASNLDHLLARLVPYPMPTAATRPSEKTAATLFGSSSKADSRPLEPASVVVTPES